MTTEQAIGLIDSAVSQMQLNRQQHNELSKALMVLVEATKETEDTPAESAKE